MVTIVTVSGPCWYLPLIRAQTVLEDAVWATFFASNIRMATVGTDYFAQGEPPSPLRHYWSLAVEEQFYLVWPLLVLLCLVWIARRGGRVGPSLRRTAGAPIAGIVVVSLVWSAWATYASPVTAYFSTFARAWELGIGAACALLPEGFACPRRAAAPGVRRPGRSASPSSSPRDDAVSRDGRAAARARHRRADRGRPG